MAIKRGQVSDVIQPLCVSDHKGFVIKVLVRGLIKDQAALGELQPFKRGGNIAHFGRLCTPGPEGQID
jgi:hypothetical protein